MNRFRVTAEFTISGGPKTAKRLADFNRTRSTFTKHYLISGCSDFQSIVAVTSHDCFSASQISEIAEFGEALEHFQFRVERTRLMVPSRAWLYLSEERELKYWLGYHTFHLAERWTDELKKICQNEHVALAYDSSSVLSRGGWFFWHLSKKFFDGEMAARREFDSLLHRLEYLGVVATPNDILRAVCFDSNPLLDHRWLPNQ